MKTNGKQLQKSSNVTSKLGVFSRNRGYSKITTGGNHYVRKPCKSLRLSNSIDSNQTTAPWGGGAGEQTVAPQQHSGSNKKNHPKRQAPQATGGGGQGKIQRP